MVISVPTNKRKFFRQALEILKPIPPISYLTKGKLDFVAELLYLNYEYRSIEKTLRDKILFEYSTKHDIRERLGVSEAVFNNMLHSLRKIGIIVGNSLATDFGINPDNNSITFSFKFDE